MHVRGRRQDERVVRCRCANIETTVLSTCRRRWSRRYRSGPNLVNCGGSSNRRERAPLLILAPPMLHLRARKGTRQALDEYFLKSRISGVMANLSDFTGARKGFRGFSFCLKECQHQRIQNPRSKSPGEINNMTNTALTKYLPCSLEVVYGPQISC